MIDNQYIVNKYGFKLNSSYLKACEEFREEDSQLQHNYHIHHIVPRCCGGDNSPENLIKVSIPHHVKLHGLILNSRRKKKKWTISSSQYMRLKYAHDKMVAEYWFKET